MFSGPWQQVVTRLIVLITPIIWIAWDFYAYYSGGNAATESIFIWRNSYHAPGIAFLVGVLCGHLFFQVKPEDKQP